MEQWVIRESQEHSQSTGAGTSSRVFSYNKHILGEDSHSIMGSQNKKSKGKISKRARSMMADK